MVRKRQCFLAVIWFLSWSLSSSVTGQEPISVITYNLEGMKPGTAWETRLIHIIDGLIALNPDIMGFQEVAQTSAANNMAQTIADSLSTHFNVPYHVYWQSTHVAYDSYTEGIAIVTKLPVLGTGYQNLPIAVFPRKVLWNRLASDFGEVHFFTTHLAYREEDNTFRINQVNTIKNYINGKMDAFPAVGTLLCGDFNCTPDSDPIAALVNYSSSWFTLHPTLSGYTFPVEVPTKKIDYIFTENSTPVTITHCSLIIYSPYDGVHYPSDHRGIQAAFEFQPTALDEEIHPITPAAYELRCYPNPFNSVAKISYDLPADANVSLTIFDLSGQKISMLASETQSSGHHEYRWNSTQQDGTPVSTGIYFVRLTAGTDTTVIKLLYLK